MEVVRYHPEVRCTFRLDVKWKSSEPPLRTQTLYGKIFNDDQGKDLHQLIRMIWMTSKGSPDSFIIARPLSYDDTLGILWQEALSGESLRGIIDNSNYEGYIDAAAKGLAFIHKSDLSRFIQKGTFDRIEDILEQIENVMKDLPRFDKSLGSIVLELKQNFPHLTPITDRPVHGSFRIKELLVCEKGLAVFDLDKLTMGDWVRDLALFLVDLHCIYRDSPLLCAMSKSFYRAYRSHVDFDLPADRLKWHIQVQFLKRIIWIYKNRRLDDRLENRIQHVITLARNGIAFDAFSNKPC